MLRPGVDGDLRVKTFNLLLELLLRFNKAGVLIFLNVTIIELELKELIPLKRDDKQLITVTAV